ncbi:MAG: response regulator [Gemmatimonadales bacterium]
MEPVSGSRSLVLVIADDNDGRRVIRKLFDNLGFDVVHASNGLVGLELIQRLPRRFQLVLIDLDIPGVPAVVIMETLRLFRPELPVLCMGEREAVGVLAAPERCLSKPLRAEELRPQVEAALAGAPRWEPASGCATEPAVLRARARYAEGKRLVDAALELARGLRGE